MRRLGLEFWIKKMENTSKTLCLSVSPHSIVVTEKEKSVCFKQLIPQYSGIVGIERVCACAALKMFGSVTRWIRVVQYSTVGLLLSFLSP